MNAASDIAEFLVSRRAGNTPEQAGLPSYGTRRVPGLRREALDLPAGWTATPDLAETSSGGDTTQKDHRT